MSNKGGRTSRASTRLSGGDGGVAPTHDQVQAALIAQATQATQLFAQALAQNGKEKPKDPKDEFCQLHAEVTLETLLGFSLSDSDMFVNVTAVVLFIVACGANTFAFSTGAGAQKGQWVNTLIDDLVTNFDPNTTKQDFRSTVVVPFVKLLAQLCFHLNGRGLAEMGDSATAADFKTAVNIYRESFSRDFERKVAALIGPLGKVDPIFAPEYWHPRQKQCQIIGGTAGPTANLQKEVSKQTTTRIAKQIAAKAVPALKTGKRSAPDPASDSESGEDEVARPPKVPRLETNNGKDGKNQPGGGNQSGDNQANARRRKKNRH